MILLAFDSGASSELCPPMTSLKTMMGRVDVRLSCHVLGRHGPCRKCHRCGRRPGLSWKLLFTPSSMTLHQSYYYYCSPDLVPFLLFCMTTYPLFYSGNKLFCRKGASVVVWFVVFFGLFVFLSMPQTKETVRSSGKAQAHHLYHQIRPGLAIVVSQFMPVLLRVKCLLRPVLFLV